MCWGGGGAPFRPFQAAENWPGASTCDEVAAKDNISCYQEDGLTVNINLKQRNVDKHSRNDHTCITDASLPLERNGLPFGGLGDALINLHGRLYTWVFGINAPPSRPPPRTAVTPLHITIWLTLSNAPTVQASFTSDTNPEPGGAAS